MKNIISLLFLPTLLFGQSNINFIVKKSNEDSYGEIIAVKTNLNVVDTISDFYIPEVFYLTNWYYHDSLYSKFYFIGIIGYGTTDFISHHDAVFETYSIENDKVILEKRIIFAFKDKVGYRINFGFQPNNIIVYNNNNIIQNIEINKLGSKIIIPQIP